MTKRTIQFYGQGLGSATTEIIATFQGQTVYSGPVPTASTILAPNNQYLLFSVDALDVTDQGSFAVTITSTVEDVNMTYVLANYTLIINPVYTWEQWEIISDPSKKEQGLEIISSLASPPFTEAELAVFVDPNTTREERDAILAAHGVSYTVSTGPDGFSDKCWSTEPQMPELMSTNQTLEFELNLEAGIE